ncbi:MAG TPA: hypothetical protein PKD83_06760 [Ignavibacteria bacterium]|nr:hypothetical protein [Ignavibacteria bacterium]
MKTKSFLTVCCFVLFFFMLNRSVFAQSQTDTMRITDLKAPSSPAFIILGINPTAIEKPATPKALGATILNSFNDLNVLPRNFAFEVAPYWLNPDPGITFDKYFQNSNILKNIYQNLAFSIATAPLDSPKNGSSLSFGIRSLIFNTNEDVNNLKQVKEYYKVMTNDVYRTDLIHEIEDNTYTKPSEIQNFIKVYIDRQKSNPNVLSEYGDKNEILSSIQDSLIKYLNQSAKSQNIGMESQINSDKTKTLTDYIKSKSEANGDAAINFAKKEARLAIEKRSGFKLEFSGAVTGDFRNDSVKNGEFSRLGFWLTPAYSVANFDFIGVMRYIGLFESKEIKNNDWIAGARILFKTGSFAASFETLTKMQTKIEPSIRYILNLDYKLTEKIYITGSFGKNFDGTSLTEDGNLLTLLGINFNMGADPIVKF